MADNTKDVGVILIRYIFFWESCEMSILIVIYFSGTLLVPFFVFVVRNIVSFVFIFNVGARVFLCLLSVYVASFKKKYLIGKISFFLSS